MNVVLLHGCCGPKTFRGDKYPSMSNHNWFPWLQKKLTQAGIVTQTPEMPKPYRASYEEWDRVFSQFDINEDTVLVGHSCGGGFLLKWLAQHQAKVKKLVLVAPWLDPIKKRPGFLDRTVNPNIAELAGEIHIFLSEDEPVDGVKESVDIIMKALPDAKLRRFETHGHFTLNGIGKTEFRELLELIQA